MTESGKRWTAYDHDGNPICLTEERWSHITGPLNHPEMADCEEQLKRAIRQGRRRQELLNPRKYRYSQAFDDLPDDMTHVVAMVLFGFDVDAKGETIPNNFVATAFMKHIRPQGGRE